MQFIIPMNEGKLQVTLLPHSQRIIVNKFEGKHSFPRKENIVIVIVAGMLRTQ